MSDIILTNHTCSSMTVISNRFLDYYLPSASGEDVKIYLLLLRYASAGQSITLSSLAKQLNHTEKEVHHSLNYWEKLGLLHITTDRQKQILSMQLLPIPQDNTELVPEKKSSLYSMQEDGNTMTNLEAPPKKNSKGIPKKTELSPIELEQNIASEDLNQIIFVTETYLGKTLTHADLNTLNYIHDTLGLSGDLIEYLVEYCVSLNKKSLRYIESVAIAWYEQGLRTVDEAKTSVKIHTKNYSSIMKAFGLSGRNFGTIEIEFVEKWLKTYGFPLSIVLEACDRTLKTIQQPSFQYADTILTDWHNAGAKSMEEVEKLDEAHKYAKKPSVTIKNTKNKFHNFEQRSYNYKELEQRFIEKINQSKKGEDESCH